jgi:glycosyltransferase involved in cell wall biosynthesis
VPLGRRDAVTTGLADAFEHLRGDPRALQRVSECALRLACREYSWDAKAAYLVGLYRRVLGHGNRPFSAATPTPGAR